MTRPVVVVIETPNEDPSTYVNGDVETLEISAYPPSKHCPDEEFRDYMDPDGGYLDGLIAARDALGADAYGSAHINRIIRSFNERAARMRHDDSDAAIVRSACGCWTSHEFKHVHKCKRHGGHTDDVPQGYGWSRD